MLHLLEVQCQSSDLEDGLVIDHDGVGTCVEGCLWGKAECLLSST